MIKLRVGQYKFSLAFLISVFFIFGLVFSTIFINLFNPNELWVTNVEKSLLSPSWHYPFGTDSLGRDLLYRTLYGSQISLGLGVLSSLAALIIGVAYGSLSALMGGWFDIILMRILEVFKSLPPMITVGLMVLLMGKINASTSGSAMVFKLVFAISLSSWMIFARFSRNMTLKEKSLPYVEAARAIGAGPLRVFLNHILRGMSSSLIILTGLQIPNFILFEGLLSFLGIGVQPPVSSWGLLIQEGWKTLSVYPHLLLGPSFILFITVLSFNIIFDELRVKQQSAFGAVDTHQ